MVQIAIKIATIPVRRWMDIDGLRAMSASMTMTHELTPVHSYRFTYLIFSLQQGNSVLMEL